MYETLIILQRAQETSAQVFQHELYAIASPITKRQVVARDLNVFWKENAVTLIHSEK